MIQHTVVSDRASFRRHLGSVSWVYSRIYLSYWFSMTRVYQKNPWWWIMNLIWPVWPTTQVSKYKKGQSDKIPPQHNLNLLKNPAKYENLRLWLFKYSTKGREWKICYSSLSACVCNNRVEATLSLPLFLLHSEKNRNLFFIFPRGGIILRALLCLFKKKLTIIKGFLMHWNLYISLLCTSACEKSKFNIRKSVTECTKEGV